MNSSPERQDRTFDPKNMLRAFLNLNSAIAGRRSRKWCLTLWSRFIRARDGYRCLNCEATGKVFAHHIFRRTVLPEAELQTGNGITLCAQCHQKVHAKFNGKPAADEALNARGGDDQDYIQSLFHALERDGAGKNLSLDEYYCLSDEVLVKFKEYQGFDPADNLDIPRISQAHLIWQQGPVGYYKALGSAIGVELLTAFLLRGK